MYRYLLGVFLLINAVDASGTARFIFTTNTKAAYNHLLALRIDKGRELLRKEAADDPAAAFVTDYADFLTLFIDEDRAAFRDKQAAVSERLAIIRKGDKNSPYYAFCQAEVLLHQAFLKIKFGDYLEGGTGIRDAYQLLEKNIATFPDFQPQYKSMGMLEVLVGTIPGNYQWVVKMIGMKGSIDNGMQKISRFINAPHAAAETEMMKQEALFIYAFLQLHIVKNKAEAWVLVEKNTTDHRYNLMKTYIRATVALHCNKTDEAIKTLAARPRGEEVYPFYYLDYLMGVAKMHRLDTNADISFKIFVTYFKGENYIKDAYLKLAWLSLLDNRQQEYNNYLLLVKTRGKENFDEDKQAMREAKSGEKQDTVLLKARMLFDGGYFQRSLDILNAVNADKLTGEKYRTELDYRKGRAYHEMGITEKALLFYQAAITRGKAQPWYFAANASLQKGIIYEERGDYGNAREAYKNAAIYPTAEYKNSIAQKSKAGLKRIEGK